MHLEVDLDAAPSVAALGPALFAAAAVAGRLAGQALAARVAATALAASATAGPRPTRAATPS